uniref:NADH:ubiquinone oxidoreductase subunit V3 n=1 Tax=Echeneis naucrates TaxID=173247 RepID=A0A665W0J2_ECHNA
MGKGTSHLSQSSDLQHLQVECWDILRCSAAPLCTQAEGSPKEMNTASKTEVPGDRAALLAYKTAVTFPVRFILPHSVGANEPVNTAQTDAAALPVALAWEAAGVPDVAWVIADTPPPAGDGAAPVCLVSSTSEATRSENTFPPAIASFEPGSPVADGVSSSSSSDSDLDSGSDSDSEDDKSEVKTETKTLATEVSECPVKEEAEFFKFTSEPKKETESKKEGQLGNKVEILTVSTEEFEDFVPEICAKDYPEVISTCSTVSGKAALKPAPEVIEEFSSPAPSVEDQTKITIPEKLTIDVAVEATEPPPAKALGGAAAAAEVAAKAIGDETIPAGLVAEAAEVAANGPLPLQCAEMLVDPAPCIGEVAGEELQGEAPMEPLEDPAAVQSDEPFDSSTYKNYQHHNYTPYTFADLDVEMAKFRLPQPSSGRPSPRH